MFSRSLMAAVAGVALLIATSAQAVMNPTGSTCNFTEPDASTVLLQGDCTTTETIWLEDGETLDGQGFAITAEDPDGNHFLGAVIENATADAEIHVTGLVVQGNLTENACDSGADRLRGILFREANGSITHSSIQSINQGPSGCQEGNAIEVRNPPFDGTGTEDRSVTIAHNVIENWQKTGVVCNGDVDCTIQHNVVGPSATQENLAPNSIQIGFGGKGLVELNHIAGNEWLGTTNFVGTAVLTFEPIAATIRRNNISGNAQVGILAFSGANTVDNNRVFERSADGRTDFFDVGLWEIGADNSVTNNKVRGYDDPAVSQEEDGDITGTKVVPSPGDPGEACFLPDASAQSC